MYKLRRLCGFVTTVMLFTLGPVALYAAVLVDNGFEAGVGNCAGASGSGWSQDPGLYDPSKPQFVDNAVNITGAERGTISFDLMRKQSDAERASVFMLLDEDGNKLMLAQIKWETKGFGDKPMLLLRGYDFMKKGAGLWSSQMLLNSTVDPGEWIHIAMRWDDPTHRYELLVNGVEEDTTPLLYNLETGKVFKDKRANGAKGFEINTFGHFLSLTKTIRIGNNFHTGSESGSSPLVNAVIDNFKLEVLEDTVAPEPVARIIAEAVWGGEIEVSYTASPSSDVSEYLIYRGVGEAPDTAGKPYTSTSALKFTDTDVISGATYNYRVVVVDQSGNRSAPSDTVGVVAVAGEGPRISSIESDATGRPLRPGQELQIALTGQSGGNASATFADGALDIKLKEEGATGVYKGTYTVTDEIVGATTTSYMLIGKLSDDYGSSSLAGPDIAIVGRDVLDDVTPPLIAGADHNARDVAGIGGMLVAGDLLMVTLDGEPGGFAGFELSGFSDAVEMEETAPGHYAGSYAIGFDDEGQDLTVTASLTDLAGNKSTIDIEDPIYIDTRVRLLVSSDDELLPADTESKTRITVKAENAKGDDVPGHELVLTLSTTSEYTGVVGGGKMADMFASADDEDDLEIRFDGVTDSFGEVSATYTAGFAAKTALIIAKDLTTGDVGAGWLNTYVASTVAIELLPSSAKASTMPIIRLSASPAWLTADGRSKTRIRAWLTDPAGTPIASERMRFALQGNNGKVRLLDGVTDAAGMAEAEYRAGTLAGMVTVTATVGTLGAAGSIQIELRSDAPAKIGLCASRLQLPADGRSTSDIRAVVTDINDNPNKQAPISFSIVEGTGKLSESNALTNDDAVAITTYTAGRHAATVVVEAHHTSRAPTEDELNRVSGTIFVPRLIANQEHERIRVSKWLVEPGDTVAKGQGLVIISMRGQEWTLTAHYDGTLVRQVRFKRDSVQLGDTIGYIEPAPEQ